MFNSLVWGWLNKMSVNYRIQNNYADLQKIDGVLWLLVVVRWKWQDKCRYHTEYEIGRSLILSFHGRMWRSIDCYYLKFSACQISSKGYSPPAGYFPFCNHQLSGKQTVLESFKGDVMPDLYFFDVNTISHHTLEVAGNTTV